MGAGREYALHNGVDSGILNSFYACSADVGARD